MTSAILLSALVFHFLARQALTSVVAAQSKHSGPVTYLAGGDTITILWLGYVGILGHVFWQLSLEPLTSFHIAAYMVLLGGTLLRSYGIVALRGFYFATTAIAAHHRVVQEGPFRWLRHPLYLGLSLELFGLLALAPSPGTFALVLVLVLEIQRHVRIEQRLLSVHLGREYRDFCTATWDVSDALAIVAATESWSMLRMCIVTALRYLWPQSAVRHPAR